MIYLMAADDTGYVKIGVVRGGIVEVEKRRRELQCGCPYELIVLACLPGDQASESRLHREFSERRTRGEWFEFRDGDCVDLVTARLFTPDEVEHPDRQHPGHHPGLDAAAALVVAL